MKKLILIFLIAVIASCNSHERVEPFVEQRLINNGIHKPELWTVVTDSCDFYWSVYDEVTPKLDSIRLVRREEAEAVIEALKKIK